MLMELECSCRGDDNIQRKSIPLLIATFAKVGVDENETIFSLSVSLLLPLYSITILLTLIRLPAQNGDPRGPGNVPNNRYNTMTQIQKQAD